MSIKKLNGPFKLPLNNKPDKLVIFLHGVGSDGYDLISLAEEFAQILPNAAFLSPNAPFAYDMYPSGYQWFSLADYNSDKLYEGIKAALPILQNFIDENLKKFNLEYKDLVLIGFSQGTMMALQIAPRLEKECFAVIGFAGALIKPETLKSEMKSKPNICLIHGDIDQVVPLAQHFSSIKAFEAINLPLDQSIIKGLGHSINEEALEYAKNYLKNLLI